MSNKQNIKTPGKGGKRMKLANASLIKEKSYNVLEILEQLKQNSKVKFDETLEVAINLGVDPRHSDQMVRGIVSLPYGIGKSIRVAVFARDAKAEEAKLAGADIVGAEDLVEQISAGNIDFDKCIATPDLMPLIVKVAKILGPRGLMPNPKLGSVTANISEAVNLAKSGQIEFKVEKAGIVHAPFGKVNFSVDALYDNLKVLLNAIIKAKPSGAKGAYIKSVFITSTMGVAYKLDFNTIGQ
ncbi:Ribosomal protein L1 [Rickettsiales bacterium Ac37b]|nr:Ribosomal protein L1 [Rickettsiales bacterium Ac37b]